MHGRVKITPLQNAKIFFLKIPQLKYFDFLHGKPMILDWFNGIFRMYAPKDLILVMSMMMMIAAAALGAIMMIALGGGWDGKAQRWWWEAIDICLVSTVPYQIQIQHHMTHLSQGPLAIHSDVQSIVHLNAQIQPCSKKWCMWFQWFRGSK